MASDIFNPYYAAEVLSDLLSRQRGREVKIVLTPKDPTKDTQTNSTGG